METIFYCLIRTDKNTEHSRIEYFPEKKSLLDFKNWIIKHIDEIGGSCIVVSINKWENLTDE